MSLRKNIRNTFKRIIYQYYLRDLNIGSILLAFGMILTILGSMFGGYHWLEGNRMGVPSLPGTVTLAAMTVLIGINFLMGFVSFDCTPKSNVPLQKRMGIFPKVINHR